jgi:hypothetical protein
MSCGGEIDSDTGAFKSAEDEGGGCRLKTAGDGNFLTTGIAGDSEDWSRGFRLNKRTEVDKRLMKVKEEDEFIERMGFDKIENMSEFKGIGFGGKTLCVEEGERVVWGINEIISGEGAEDGGKGGEIENGFWNVVIVGGEICSRDVKEGGEINEIIIGVGAGGTGE